MKAPSKTPAASALLKRKTSVVAVGTLKLTDALSAEQSTKSLRVVLRLKR